MKILILSLILFANLAAAGEELQTSHHDPGRSHYVAPVAATAPMIDGYGSDDAWRAAPWRPIDNIWLGEALDPADFSGRYKLTWTAQKLYVLVEFVDDVLVDFHRDPLLQYWDDDCLEIFIDEDHSGGNHQYNHNAFAYHLSLDNQAIDIGTDQKARRYNDHVISQWRQHGDKVIWEVAVDVYSDDYRDDAPDNTPVTLAAGKIIGFMLAYCDNDHSELREHFVGSEHAAGEHKDRGWIDANLFGKLELTE